MATDILQPIHLLNPALLLFLVNLPMIQPHQDPPLLHLLADRNLEWVFIIEVLLVSFEKLFEQSCRQLRKKMWIFRQLLQEVDVEVEEDLVVVVLLQILLLKQLAL